jgi:hypothetical protein
VTNYHPPPVAATSRFENMARKQPRCAVGPPCGRRVPGQLHLDRFITHLPQCPLSWYTHPTYTLLPPAPSSLPWFRRVIGLGITNCLPRREHVPPFETDPQYINPSVFVVTCPQGLWQRLRVGMYGTFALSPKGVTHQKGPEHTSTQRATMLQLHKRPARLCSLD